jgi:hypothetical protein
VNIDLLQPVKIAVSHEGSAITDENGSSESFWLKAEFSMIPEEPGDKEIFGDEFRWACLDLLSMTKAICDEHKARIEFVPDCPDEDDPTAGEFPLDPIEVDKEFSLEDL